MNINQAGSFADIKLEAIDVGRDLLLLVTGGESHIGATSTAYLYEDIIQVQTIAVPEHKEHLLTEQMANQAASHLRRTVTVVMGIHYNGLTKEEIVQVSDITALLLKQYLQSSTSS